MFDESNMFDHTKKSLHVMGSGWGPRGNEEHVNLTTEMLCISFYALNDPLRYFPKSYFGLNDFTDKSLQLTTQNLCTRSECELLHMPVFDVNGKFIFLLFILMHAHANAH